MGFRMTTSSTTGRPFRMLFVEDDAASRETLRENLKERGIDAVDFATNTKEADQHIAAQNYDAILVDLKLDDEKQGDEWLLENQARLGDTLQAIVTAQPQLISDQSRLSARGIRIVPKGNLEISFLDELESLRTGRVSAQDSLSQDDAGRASNTADALQFAQIGVANNGVSDQASSVDLLGFDIYVDAVAAFLTHPKTTLPLTMSVEGEWGSGKSSFMKQLEERLTPRFKTVQFNAWRHERADEMWAAFALHFIKGIRPTNWFARVWADAKLATRQFDFASGWLDLLRVVCWFLTLATATITVISVASVFGPAEILALIGKSPTAISSILGRWFGPSLAVTSWLATTTALLLLWRAFFQHVKSPLEIELRRFLKRPNYESKLGFVEQFQADIAQAVATYLKSSDKVYVFIDDLDRCELPQAAELMRAINLMLSERGPICFIIGMDRAKIAAALAVKHELLLPYLASDGVPESLRGVLFGYAFIEKFVQIPFAVPSLSAMNLDRFLASLAHGGRADRLEKEVAPSSSTRSSEIRPAIMAFVRKLDDESEHFGSSAESVDCRRIG